MEVIICWRIEKNIKEAHEQMAHKVCGWDKLMLSAES